MYYKLYTKRETQNGKVHRSQTDKHNLEDITEMLKDEIAYVFKNKLSGIVQIREYTDVGAWHQVLKVTTDGKEYSS